MIGTTGKPTDTGLRASCSNILSFDLEKMDRHVPRALIVIVNYNSGRYLKRCLEAIFAQTFLDFSVVVVDNNSTDSSLDCCKKWDDSLSVLKLPRNAGFAAANNLIGLTASSDWIATLNPDAIPDKDWLRRLMLATERYPDVAMFGSTQICESYHGLIDGAGDVYSCSGLMWRGHENHPVSDLPEEGYVFSPCAAGALYKTEVFKSVGGFDESFFCYCEDVDLAFRMRLRGHTCIQVKDAVIYHARCESAVRRGDFRIYHGFRNRLSTFVKNMPSPLFYFLCVLHVGMTLFLLARATLVGEFKPAWKGLADAVRRFPTIWDSRREIQKARVASNYQVAGAMTWSPLKPFLRGHDVRPAVARGGETRNISTEGDNSMR